MEDFISLWQRSIYHGTHRDAGSGGVINFYHVTKEGLVKIYFEDMMVVQRKNVVDRKTEDDDSDATKSVTY